MLIGAWVFGLASVPLGCAHDIQTCSECPTPSCPQAPVTELGVQCANVCTTLGMRQIAHFNHGSWYSCSCGAPGRLCAYYSPNSSSGGGDITCSEVP